MAAARLASITRRIKPLQVAFTCRTYITSTSHHNLETFRRYAASTSLSTTSTYYVGTLYEYIVAIALEKFNMTLRRCGGNDDRGIDLRGGWGLVDEQRTIPMIVQCKAEQRKLGPKYVRELEGASLKEGPDTLTLLATLSNYTKAAQTQVISSSRPLGLCVVGPANEGAQVTHMIWNGPAMQLIGPDYALTQNYGLKDMSSDLVLTYCGKVVRA
jgi:hypothetical protein